MFWFHQFKYFYYFIPLTISSLILPYILYSIKSYVDYFVKKWSPEIRQIEVPHYYGVLPTEDYDGPLISMYLTLEQFIPHHTEQIYLEKDDYYYKISLENKYYKQMQDKYNYTDEIIPDYFYNLMFKPFIKMIEDITQINMILKYYEFTMFYTSKPLLSRMKPFKVILYMGYLMC